MTPVDWLDPEAPEAEDDRPQWEPIYMGEGHPKRCANCHRTQDAHWPGEQLALYCHESYLRIQDGNR